MIDFNKNWRIIDIDGITFSEQNNINDIDKNPSTCIYNNYNINNYPLIPDDLKRTLNNDNISSLEEIVKNYNDNDIQNLVNKII